jgi:hypothetical protein
MEEQKDEQLISTKYSLLLKATTKHISTATLFKRAIG